MGMNHCSPTIINILFPVKCSIRLLGNECKFNTAGARCPETSAFSVALVCMKISERLNIRCTPYNFRLTNLLLTCKVFYAIDLTKLEARLGFACNYQKANFSGLTYPFYVDRLGRDVTVNIFETGAINFIGCKLIDDGEIAMKQLLPLIEDCFTTPIDQLLLTTEVLNNYKKLLTQYVRRKLPRKKAVTVCPVHHYTSK
jgi:hypothetical protein